MPHSSTTDYYSVALGTPFKYYRSQDRFQRGLDRFNLDMNRSLIDMHLRLNCNSRYKEFETKYHTVLILQGRCQRDNLETAQDHRSRHILDPQLRQPVPGFPRGPLAFS